jgi:DNA-binding response OmpR family regulator
MRLADREPARGLRDANLNGSRTEHTLNRAALVIGEKESDLVVRTALECAGHQCTAFASTTALLRGIKRDDHSLIVLDIDDPAVEWQAVLDWRRNWLNPGVPVLLVGAAAPGVAAQTLDAGADDFVIKPVRGAELLARIQAATRRRSHRTQTPQVAQAGCTLDRSTSSLNSPRSRVGLTARELAVAQLMFEHAGQLVSRRRLASAVWSGDEELTGRSIEQHIYQLRRKIKLCVGDALALRGVYGSGYRLDVVTSA